MGMDMGAGKRRLIISARTKVTVIFRVIFTVIFKVIFRVIFRVRVNLYSTGTLSLALTVPLT